MWTERQTDRCEEANKRFSLLVEKAPKEGYEISEGNIKHVIRIKKNS